MSRNRWPVVVGGCHRSGTSLVRRILNAHPRVHCGPEVKFFRDLAGDYQHDPLRHLRFTASARALVSEADLLEVLGGAFIALHERAAERAGKPRWADKNPDNLLYLDRWQNLLGDRWLLVHVVRNPLDTLASIKEARFPLSIPPELEARIHFYRRYTQAGLDFGTANPDRYYRLVYEELVESPEAAVARLMEWLGERFDPAQLSFNDVPQGGGLEDPKVAATSGIHSESIGRWAQALSPGEQRTISRETRDLWEVIDPDRRWSLD